MGVNCCEVIQIIHIGPPDDCSDYIQQCGSASRRTEAASTVLLYKTFCKLTVEPEISCSSCGCHHWNIQSYNGPNFINPEHVIPKCITTKL